MPDTQIERTQTYGMQSLIRSPALRTWNREWLNVEEPAQDQFILRILRANQVVTIRGLKTSTHDAQSESTSFPSVERPEGARGWTKSPAELFRLIESRLAELATHYRNLSEQHAPARREPRDSCQELGVSANEQEWTPDVLADALLGPDGENDWPRLRELIWRAEDTEFSVEQSARLAPRLLELAIRHRDIGDPQDDGAVFSAIRTGASMLRPSEARRLRPLLEPGHPIETSLVAVKMLGRIFEAQPPSDVDQFPELAADVRRITDSLLNRYAIAISQSAAMAQLAIYALAAMGSTDSQVAVKCVRELDVTWFTRRTIRKLSDLTGYWTSRSVAGSVAALLDRLLNILRA